VIIVCMTLVSRWFPERYFPPLVGMLEAFALIGGGMGPLLIPELMELSGWRGAMECLAMAGIVLAICFAFWVRSWPRGGQVESQCQIYESEDARKSMGCGCFLKCCFYGFGLFAMITCFGGLWGMPYLNERFPGQESAVSDVLSLIFAGAAIGAPLLGWLASATGRTLLIMLGSGVSTLVFSSLLMFCPCCLGVMGVFCFMVGLSSGGYMLAFSLVKKLSPPRFAGLLLACANGSMLLAGPVLQSVVGFILDARSTNGIKALSIVDYQVAFVPLLICQLLALIAAVLFHRGRLPTGG
ncbi:MAG: MFS transporter, partial [Endozoicomonas sp.]